MGSTGSALKVVTVWWQSEKYPESYVRALKSQIPGLTVLTQGDGLYESDRYRGWWAKLEVFRPENRPLRPCLCVDLDTFVFDVEPILALDPERLWLIREFLGTRRRAESGLFIAPRDGISDLIWEGAKRLELHDRLGDGAFLRTFPHSFIPDHVSGIYSYKAHCRESVPGDARVICFHGKPKPHQCGGWAEEYWKRHAGLVGRGTVSGD